ncbi:hypothetical protein D9M68_757280 [compost metagenome]
MAVVEAGAAGHARGIRARALLRQRKSGNALAAGNLRQDRGLQCLGSGQADGAAAQPLHRESEIRQPMAIGQRFARQRQPARFDGGRVAAVGLRHARAQQAGSAHGPDQVSAARIDIGGGCRRIVAAVGKGLHLPQIVLVGSLEKGKVHRFTLMQGKEGGAHERPRSRRRGTISLTTYLLVWTIQYPRVFLINQRVFSIDLCISGS